MGDYESSRCDNLESILRDTSAQPCDLRLQYLKDITNDFSIERELGRGGSAVVYKGVLHNGEMIAVKNLVSMSEVQEKHFKSEVDNLMRVKHQNIVRFIGYCYETWHEYIEYNGLRVFADKPKRLLCFEYMPNGSLDRYISEESCGLDWRNRYKIIKGICSGLHYLHKECEINASVIHLDLKPANILLDDNMVPKIADFGLSRLFNDTKIETRATTLAGSYGYMAPEYLCNHIITTKADIYSLGVIIIEMITGRRISPFDDVTTWRDFMEPVLKNWRKRLEAAARYTSLEIECEQIKSSLEIGLSCIKLNRTERPTTVEIMESLIRWESTNCYVSDEEKPPADKVLQRDNVMKKFQEVIAQLEHALFDFPYEKLDGSDEVREQVELVHAQLKRTKGRFEMPDDEFYDDILSNKSYSPSTELDIPKRLSEKLHLTTITDLTQEWLALHEMVASGCGQDPGEHIEKTSILLKKIEDSVQTQNPDTGPQMVSKLMDSNGDPRPVIIPDQFRCPISLELMTDPVVVVTGQTYERAHIEEWLASGYRICPATQQRLTSTTLTPNYILRSLIVQWCKTNRIEPPKRSLSESVNIDVLTSQLCSPDTEQQRSAAAELRLLAKCSANNRICIAESGAIPLLLSLLSSSDLQTQEHAVTALLNLSIHADNKAIIVSSGAVPSIVDILKNGSMEARENAAATLFSLSVFNEYKVTIGEAGAIPALVVLLSQGSQQAKKDAAAALFNLCIYQGNKGRAIRAGLVPIIMGLLANPTGGLMDEAMAILSILSSHPEGKVVIWASEPVPVLVETIGSGSPRNRENAATVMLHLCIGGQQLAPFTRAQECGIMGPLRELAMNGTERGKKKAVQLLELMNSTTRGKGSRAAEASAQAPGSPNRSRLISLNNGTVLVLDLNILCMHA